MVIPFGFRTVGSIPYLSQLLFVYLFMMKIVHKFTMKLRYKKEKNEKAMKHVNTQDTNVMKLRPEITRPRPVFCPSRPRTEHPC